MNIGLVLSGGMAKGAYQIGALKALEKFVPFNEIKYISCASVGVLNGYAYATNRLDYAEHVWKKICCKDTRIIISKILKSSFLQQNLESIYDEKEKISSVFYCTLLDLSHKNLVYKDLSVCDSSQIPLYLKASIAMPVYNSPVQISNTSFFDGAMVDNIPVYPLLKHNLDYIICIYFDDACYKFENTYFDNKIIKLNFPGKSLVKQSLLFERDSIEEMIKDGYDKTMYILETVFSKGYLNLEHIYHSIDYMNHTKGSSDLRITGDALVTNLNKITQKLTKRKIL